MPINPELSATRLLINETAGQQAQDVSSTTEDGRVVGTGWVGSAGGAE